MSLTLTEEIRIKNIETKLLDLEKLINGAASESMLNRLLTLANSEVADLNTRITTLSSKIDELIEVAKKI